MKPQRLCREERMKRYIECWGRMVEIEIVPRPELLRMNVRYISTDFEESVDVYENNDTDELIGCEA